MCTAVGSVKRTKLCRSEFGCELYTAQILRFPTLPHPSAAFLFHAILRRFRGELHSGRVSSCSTVRWSKGSGESACLLRHGTVTVQYCLEVTCLRGCRPRTDIFDVITSYKSMNDGCAHEKV
ncbi:hypothetical protein EVAR_88048_1 [Eumeta japonica]|uniref:Uncharacterized protein n=1 Tax=Eumeta variegata TaxID=151549 RepID=A0A4C1VBG1_EUMVA|nr:hypothetical protein EVAR_88048_1 [Eumeta japonica]